MFGSGQKRTFEMSICYECVYKGQCVKVVEIGKGERVVIGHAIYYPASLFLCRSWDCTVL